MTAQVSETLILQGKKLSMCSEPLLAYFAMAGIKSPFISESSDCWRGYVGTWTIENDRLYLKCIDGRSAHGTKIGMADLFPGYLDRVFAHWYSGEIRCPSGKLLNYVHAGYGSRYEKDIFVTVRKGVLKDQRIVINAVSTESDAGYSVGAETVVLRRNAGRPYSDVTSDE